MKTNLEELEASLEGLKNLRVEHSKRSPGILTITDTTTGGLLEATEFLLIGKSVVKNKAFSEAVAAACTNIFALIAEVRELRQEAERARWCEENKADVSWLDTSRRWSVVWVAGSKYHAVSDPDRSAAIDAARSVK